MGVFKRNGYWWIDYYNQGKRLRKKIGPSKKLAETVLADVQVKIAKSQFLGVQELKPVLFRDFIEEYLVYARTNKSDATYYCELCAINARYLPRWGKRLMSEITTKMIEDLKSERSLKVAASTVNNDVMRLKTMFRRAVAWGYLAQSPADPVKQLKVPKSKIRFLSKEECALLLEACRSSRFRGMSEIVAVAISTGMRRGEIFRLKWEDIDFTRMRLIVNSSRGGHTKNYESRTIPMNQFLISVLKSWRGVPGSPYVFSLTSGKLGFDLPHQFTRALKRAGIPHARFHDLRHTFASLLVMAGVDIPTVQQLLGHQDIHMTMRYAHLHPDHLRQAVEILDSHYMDTEVPATHPNGVERLPQTLDKQPHSEAEASSSSPIPR
ncbi:MAG: tyrosine-type recombinase/integrase [Desulfomonilaceae bacterium]